MPANTDTANPGPLGLVAFGLTTVLLSLVNGGILPSAGEPVVLPLALAFGGTCQFFAGLLEYREGNTFGYTAFCSYGAFWWWFGLLVLFAGNGWLSVNATAVGAALLLWGLFTAYMWVATFKLNWALWSVFLTLTITFLLLGFGDLGFGTATIGGYVGVLTGLLAMYASFAEVVNWAWDRTVVPIGGAPLSD
ncbi:succinate-acetate transporter protein [Halarchaeum solikamskense]|uniref:acetate uptake transporter n=1 Tax=Halarchaeum nitratireducens TaxID=489913 RepID=UPI001B3A9D4E|nr:acetate uptake transporter [Halarchaeum solikamskense]MBP2250222.1 succinate-acetate transporter protein [Halarchaeum solikamskense]